MADYEGVWPVVFTITGNLPRKSNSRQNTSSGFIKSKDALLYCKKFDNQAIVLGITKKDIHEPVCMELIIYYANIRSDLSDELFADCLEHCGFFRNDNYIRRKILHWELDKDNPRVEAKIYPIENYNQSWIPKFKPREELIRWLKKARIISSPQKRLKSTNKIV